MVGEEPSEKDQIVKPSVYLGLIRNGLLLWQRRRDGYGAGLLSLPAGHLRPGESAAQAAVREGREEMGVTLTSLTLMAAIHRPSVEGGSTSRLDVLFRAEEWDGEPAVNEPRRAIELEWLPLGRLPSDAVPEAAELLKRLGSPSGAFVSSGWPEPANSAGAVAPRPPDRLAMLRKTIGGHDYGWDPWSDTIVAGDSPPANNAPLVRAPWHGRPVDACIELTTKCNWSCSYCFSESSPGEPFRHLDLDQIDSYLAESRHELIRICIAGGEPLLHPKIDDVLRLPVKYPDLGWVLNTNASVKPQLDELILAGGWLVAVSVHGAEKTHNAYTNSRSFGRVVARMKKLSAAGAIVHVYSVLHREMTTADLHALLDLRDTTGAAFLRFIVPRAGGRQGSPAAPEIVEYATDLCMSDSRVGLKTTRSNTAFVDSLGHRRLTH